MSFFKSDIVRGDIQEMLELQQFCFRSAMNFVLLEDERKMDYFDALETLIEKQKIFYQEELASANHGSYFLK